MTNACPFCTIPEDRIVSESDYSITIRDGYPVSKGHTLIIPKRHVGSFFELQAMDEAKYWKKQGKETSHVGQDYRKLTWASANTK